MKYYFLLQYRRLHREIKNFGINPYAGIVVGTIVFGLISLLLFKKFTQAPYVYAGLACIFVFTQSGKNRNLFLRSIFTGKKYHQMRLAENALLILPFIIFLLLQKQFVVSSGLLFISLVFSFYNQAGYQSAFIIPTPFSRRPYEFTTGFRSSFLILAALYTVSIISFFYHNYNLGIFCLLALYFLCMNFYSYTAPVFYVWIHAQPAKIFLKEKMKTAVLYSFYLCLPLIILLFITYPAHYYITIGIAVMGTLLLLLTVLSVYIRYPGKMSISEIVQLYAGILFPPALLFLIPHFYSKALLRLKPYLQC